jgi:hypothetical protein
MKFSLMYRLCSFGQHLERSMEGGCGRGGRMREGIEDEGGERGME